MGRGLLQVALPQLQRALALRHLALPNQLLALSHGPLLLYLALADCRVMLGEGSALLELALASRRLPGRGLALANGGRPGCRLALWKR